MESKSYSTIGKIEILHPEANSIIDSKAKIEVLDSGFTWTEGPLWIEKESFLLFSDVPENKVYKWEEGKKSVVYLDPSGFMGQKFKGKESGSNGLILNKNGQLVLAQHGERQIAYMDAPLNNPSPKYVSLVNKYKGKRFNSPNDLIQDSNGNYYFTDPIFGAESKESIEQPHRGVYILTKDNEIHLLVDHLMGPNGLALTPDEKFLLVANTDLKESFLYEFELNNEKTKVVNTKVAYDFTSEVKSNEDVLDGFAIDNSGNIFMSGPQGLWILNKNYKPIARLITPKTVSNCWLTNDNKTLYITSTDKILRFKMR